MYLDVRDLTKTFGNFTALDSVSINVESHEFVCLLGPSGCGKTTLLRIIAGLTQADTGSICLQGEDLAGLPARKRGFGIVFQSYSLFPNMTVTENIGYGPKIRGGSNHDIDARVSELLNTIQLPQLAERYPKQLSGGSSSVSPWHAPLRLIPSCCCWTSRFLRSMPKCVPNYGSRFVTCNGSWVFPL